MKNIFEFEYVYHGHFMKWGLSRNNEIFDIYDLYNSKDWRNLERYFHYLYKSL